MKTLFKNFLLCGTLGWCFEIIFTALHSLRRRDMKLTGQTSLWMFPIYGMAAFLQPICGLLKSTHVLIRGGIYGLFILLTEFLAGSALQRKKVCPWDYFRSKWHIKRLIRIDYFPFWILAGLIFEWVLTKNRGRLKSSKPSS